MVSSGQPKKDLLWFDKATHDDAERKHYERLSRGFATPSATPASSVASEIAKARQQIQKSLQAGGAGAGGDVISKVSVIEQENAELRKMCSDMSEIIKKLESRLSALELKVNGSAAPADTKPASAPAAAKDDDDDDDVDLFGSDDEEESAEAERIKAERVAAYAAKKSKKPALIAKSSVLLDVKPWDDETDMAELEKVVRTIEMDGLLWGAGKLVPLAFGIKKLTIMCTVEDDKVSIEELTEKIEEFEDYVQSVDVAAFNKI
ncbi:Elongation factor 1-delta [Amphibalanus amphitrite]|uniref:Elongation factor 1-delta n=1 Tax=Amphibalanus amphitrite TaxID=1232801 RepID=A0A6A4WC46_AMPAM|nr:Elongation factor 1-delta [Amphibalanus amphitrite]KAF0301220.1 Elongation factor 1-delta [Amphibalanus amphitrite]